MNTSPLEPADAVLAHDLPPATLAEARARRNALARLLGREREAAADFLLALADFDQRRGWERLGHGSLFAFLHRELGLSKGAAWLRLTAARLLPRFPAVEAALRQGRLCLSAIGDLSRVLTRENETEVLPRFFGCSSREAREVAAAILPAPNPPRRELLTAVSVAAPSPSAPAPASAVPLSVPVGGLALQPMPAAGSGGQPSPVSGAVRAHEPLPALPGRGSRGPVEVEPLTAELHRLHLTVSKRLLAKIEAARDGLSHTMPAASTEQVLEAGLDSLLERHARTRALVKRPRAARAVEATPAEERASPRRAAEEEFVAAGPATATPRTSPHVRSRPGRSAIPAAVEREVRLRDGNRCQFPLDAGGVCGSTRQVELDHLLPVALGGGNSAANLRCACAFHNRYAAELALGPAVAGLRRGGRDSAQG